MNPYQTSEPLAFQNMIQEDKWNRKRYCIKHIRETYILWDIKNQNPLKQTELLLTETLRALSLDTKALQNVYKNAFHSTIFW